MKLILDMNLSPLWAPFFKNNGYDCSHWSTIGKPDAKDSEILKWAQVNKATIITHDLDFSALLAASGQTMPSVIQIRDNNIAPETHGALFIETLKNHMQATSNGCLISIEPQKRKLRMLPLKSE